MKIYISEDLDGRFRRIAMNVFGYGRGSLSKAAEQAIEKWCSEQDQTKRASDSGVQVAEKKPSEGVESGIDPDERQSKPSRPPVIDGDDSTQPIGSGD